MNLLKPLRRRKSKERPLRSSEPLVLKSERAPCTCPEPCERDHGNE
jgi:hypothetical protein